MAQYSEATVRVFERALHALKGKLPEEQLTALHDLVASGRLSDPEQVEHALNPKDVRDAR